jgi:hypothetical protein
MEAYRKTVETDKPPAPVSNFSAIDLDQHVACFSKQYHICRLLKFSMPVYINGEAVSPIDFLSTADSLQRSGDSSPLDGVLRSRESSALVASEAAQASGAAVECLPPQEVKSSFLTLLRESVVQRLSHSAQTADHANNRNASGGPSNTVPFKVYSNTPRLKVVYFAIHLFQNNQAFGTLTSPSDGWISPGIYCFGVHIDSIAHFSPLRYRVPDTRQAHLDY